MALSFNTDPVLAKVQRSLLAAHGVGGIKHAVQVFRQKQKNGADLSGKDFFATIQECGAHVDLSDFERKYLLIAFDENKNGTISMDEFIKHLTGGLNARRRRFITQAYDAFASDGKVVVSELQATRTNATQSSTLAGSATQLLRSGFEQAFAAELAREGSTIAKEEFLAFYAGLSLSKAMTDDDFEGLLLREWAVDNAVKPRLDETKRDWSASGGDPLLIEKPMLAKEALSRSLGKSEKLYNADHMTRVAVPPKPLGQLNPDYVSTTKKSFPHYTREEVLSSDPLATIRPA